MRNIRKGAFCIGGVYSGLSLSMTYVGIKESLILQAGKKGPDPTV